MKTIHEMTKVELEQYMDQLEDQMYAATGSAKEALNQALDTAFELWEDKYQTHTIA